MIIIFLPIDFQSRRNRQEKIIILARRSCQPGQYRNCASHRKKRWLAIPLDGRGDGRNEEKFILKIFFGKVLTCNMASRTMGAIEFSPNLVVLVWIRVCVAFIPQRSPRLY